MNVLQLVAQLRNLCRCRTVQIQAGAGFINQINGLIRQETIRDIALGQCRCLMADFIGNVHAVEGFIIAAHALEDFRGICDGRLRNGYRLEAALQGGVFLNIFAVFCEGCRADDLNFTAGQSRLEDVCGVHRAFRVARADDVVNLVNDKNDVAERLDFIDESLHTAFKLAAELCTRDEGSQIQQVYFLVFELVRHIALGNANGKTFCDSGFADTRLTNQTRIVFLTAVQNLNDAFGFAVSANDCIKLSFAGAIRQISAVCRQIFALFCLFFLATRVILADIRAGFLARCFRVVVAGEHLIEERERMCAAKVKRIILTVCVVLVRIDLCVLCIVIFGVHERMHVGHFVGDLIQIVLCNAHLAHQAVNRLQTQFFGAFQAVALVGGAALFHFRDKHHRHVFVAAGA